MNDEDVICRITWKVADLRTAYLERYGHNATDEEIREIYDRLNVSRLEEVGIEYGWTVIDEAII